MQGVQSFQFSQLIPLKRLSGQVRAHVQTPKRGDLVFFTGSPIDHPPGHVGIYLAPHRMIDAYAGGHTGED